MKILKRAFSILILASFLVGSSHPAPFATASAPTPPEIITSRSNSTINRLSSELRQAAQSTDSTARLVTVILPASSAQGSAGAVTALMQDAIVSRVLANTQWITGEIAPQNLEKLASIPDVLSVISPDTYQPADAPGIDDLRTARPSLDSAGVRSILSSGSPQALKQALAQSKSATDDWPRQPSAPQGAAGRIAPSSLQADDIHGATAVHNQNIWGEGVTVAVVDTGVDFAHPDLLSTQAVISGGPYDRWPFAYDAESGARYALNPAFTLGPDTLASTFGLTRYVQTLPVDGPVCDPATCTGQLKIESYGTTYQTTFTWPNKSKSGHYLYSLDPSYNLMQATYYLYLGYIDLPIQIPLLLVADETSAGRYDSVYVDMDQNTIFTPAELISREHPVTGLDLNADGVWDLSSGMLTWISDGHNQPPGVTVIYPEAAKHPVPQAGRLLTFLTDEEGHGTSCAGLIAAQGVISDPHGKGPMNPLLAGSQAVGGVGGAVLSGMAPKARIAAFQNGLNYPLDAWTLAVLGFDGTAQSGDEAQVVSNSWGDSGLIEDGWDPVSRFASNLNRTDAPDVTFLVATGNGGHGYGTVTSPDGGTILNIGASTSYGSMKVFETVAPEQFTYGDIQPWSARGPGALGNLAPDLVAVGAWGSAAQPLNAYYGDGQSAYDIFGGTSMSTPVAAGGMALIYQAYKQANGRWPTWSEARALILNGAQDLGYEPTSQGSGNLRVDRSVAAALGTTPSVSPAQWAAGDTQFVDYPATLHPGAFAEQTFTVTNPTGADVPVSAVTLEKVSETTFSFSYAAPRPSGNSRAPLFLQDITSLIDQYNPDLVRAQVILPYNKFDPDNSYYFATWWDVLFYDWKDLNHNQKLWTDTNQDGIVSSDELDTSQGLDEYNRFTYGYPAGTNLEADLGRDSLSRRHDGVFIGLNCIFCSQSLPLQVRLTFYKNTPWNWLDLSSDKLVSPDAAVGARLTVPEDTPPGFYQGAIQFTLPDRVQSIPVTLNVAAPLPTFDFGGEAIASQPFDNSHLFGAFNWNWRYEAGDWRFFYYDTPDGATQPGSRTVIDTTWNSPLSDVDVWAFGSQPDAYSTADPNFFGPSGLAATGGSQDTYINSGKFLRQTSSGYGREIISARPGDGLGMLALHQVLSGGDQFSEPLSGSAYQMQIDPGALALTAAPSGFDPPRLSGSQTVTVSATHAIPDGLRVLSYGFSAPQILKDQTIRQDNPVNLCTAQWVYNQNQGGLEISNGGLLEITTTSDAPNQDLDLYLFGDNGDGIYTCGQEQYLASSITSTSNEQIRINFPSDGVYWVLVHGRSIPGGSGKFDITLRAIQGAAINLQDLPIGPILANQNVPITLTYHTPYTSLSPVPLEGILYIGLPVLPNLFEVPITLQPSILLYPAPSLKPDLPSVFAQPVTFQLKFQNLGVVDETVDVHIPLPDGLIYTPASAQGPAGTTATYDDAARAIDMSAPAPAGQKVALTFAVSAQPDFLPSRVNVPASISGQTSGQHWDVSASILVNQVRFFLPVIGH
jgi:subtilisin family serine protease